MKKIFVIFALVILPQTAFAGDWVLWQYSFFAGTQNNPPIPLTEHKSLNACLVASAQEADATFQGQKKSPTTHPESVTRFIDPDGVIYKVGAGIFVRIEFRCYPYGMVPTHGHFQSKETKD